MANYEKKFNKLKKKFNKAVNEAFENGHDEGWSQGYDSGYEVGHPDGFAGGVTAHKEMIRVRMTGLFDTYMNTNKFAKAKEAKETLEYLEWEYDPAKAEAAAKADDENWF